MTIPGPCALLCRAQGLRKAVTGYTKVTKAKAAASDRSNRFLLSGQGKEGVEVDFTSSSHPGCGCRSCSLSAVKTAFIDPDGG